MHGCYEYISFPEFVTLLCGVLLYYTYTFHIAIRVFCPLPNDFHVREYSSVGHRLGRVLIASKQHPRFYAQFFFDGAVPFSHFAIQALRPPSYIFYHWSYSKDCSSFGSNFFFHCTNPQGELSLYSKNPDAKIYFFQIRTRTSSQNT